MRVYDQLSSVRVTVSASEVHAFARRWPCAGFANRGIAFVFRKFNGDLEDIADLAHPDADANAVWALAEDAQNYAAKRLRLPSLAR